MTTLRDELMSDGPHRYEYDDKMRDYVFKKGNQVLFRATTLAICYAEDTKHFGTPEQPNYTLLKHGISEHVLQHAREIQEKYRKANLPDMASEIVVAMSDLWEVETLNKILSTSGYLGRFIQQQSNSSNSQTAQIASGH